MIEPTGLGDHHLLDLAPPGVQGAERSDLGRGRHVEPQLLGLQGILGQQPGIDGVGLREQATVAPEVAHARTVGPVDRKPELDGCVEDMTLVAAGGFADDQHLPKSFSAIALRFSLEQPPHGLRLVAEHVGAKWKAPGALPSSEPYIEEVMATYLKE